MDTERLELLKEIFGALDTARADGIPSPEDIVTQALAALVEWNQYKTNHGLLRFLKNR